MRSERLLVMLCNGDVAGALRYSPSGLSSGPRIHYLKLPTVANTTVRPWLHLRPADAQGAIHRRGIVLTVAIFTYRPASLIPCHRGYRP